MRRSICYCEPKEAIAGENTTWKFSYTTAIDLPKGTSCKFDLLTQGKPMDWQIPKAASKKPENLIWIELSNKKKTKILPSLVKDNPTAAFEFVLPSDLKTGESLYILMGTPEKGKAAKGTTCQKFIQRKRCFYLYIDPKGKKNYTDPPEIFHLDIRGGLLKSLRILAPSIVSRNQRFNVVIRFEDEYGNITNNAPTGTLYELSYENLRENLQWKLFVPETGFITIPNLYFNEGGIYRIQLKNAKTKEKFFSSPIKCFEEASANLFWGVFHGQAEKHSFTENIEGLFRFFRDDQSHQFAVASPFEDDEETTPEVWKTICSQVAEFNEEDRFVSLLGFQWLGLLKEEGLRQFVYLKDNKPLLKKKDAKSSSLKKIYKSFQPKELLSIPSSTLFRDCAYNFMDFSPSFERVVEIYNSWGSSECTTREGNLFPFPSEGKKSMEYAEGSIRLALMNNHRFGFVAGGLDQRGPFASLDPSNSYSQGLTAILATKQTREGLMEALYNRSCYATTGEKIVVWFQLAQQPMGSELNTEKKPGLLINRYFSGFILGTADLKKVSLIRNGTELVSLPTSGPYLDIDFSDSEPISSSIVLKGTDGKPPFLFYYLRIVQKNGHVAWSSPVWIDCTVMPTTNKNSASKKKKA